MHNQIFWSPGVTLEQVEEQVVKACYEHFKHNKTATANALGIGIRTLDAKLEKYKEDDASRETADHVRRAENARQLARARGAPQQGDFFGPSSQPPAPRPRGLGADLPAGVAEAFSNAETGLRMEPIANAAAEQPVPVQERKEIQDMPPKRAAGGGARGTR